MRHWLNTFLRPLFAGRVSPADEAVMLEWRVLMPYGRKINHIFAQPDLIIAATALHHGLMLVSRHTKDFRHSGLALGTPWGA